MVYGWIPLFTLLLQEPGQRSCRLHVADSFGTAIVSESIQITQGTRKLQVRTDSLGSVVVDLRSGAFLLEAQGFEAAQVSDFDCDSLTVVALKLGQLLPAAGSLDIGVELSARVQTRGQRFLRLTHVVSGKSIVEALPGANRLRLSGSFSGPYVFALFDELGLIGLDAIVVSGSTTSLRLSFHERISSNGMKDRDPK